MKTAIVVTLAWLAWSGFASAAPPQGEQPYESYEKRIRAAEMVEPLTSEMFGERLNLYNGAVEFAVTDVDLQGNSSLPVQLGRRFKVQVRHHAQTTSRGHSSDAQPLGGFGDWDLEVPHIHGTFDAQYGWTGGGPGGSARCSKPAVPKIDAAFDPRDVWSGTNLHIPGQGALELLVLGPEHPRPSDGREYTMGTRELHRVRCLPSIPGYPGEGFVVVDANGVSYRFDVAIERDGGALEKRVGEHGTATVSRKHIYLMASRVEDRFGNFVDYVYENGRLTAIQSSDGRVINLGYTGDRISRIEADGREWRYEYGTGLQAVVLPDQTRWSFQHEGALSASHVPQDGTGSDRRCLGSLPTHGDYAISVTHPGGATGRFEFRYMEHARSGTPESACVMEYRDHEGNEYWTLRIPDYFYTYSLVAKTITGPALETHRWTYGWHQPETRRAAFEGPFCQGCDPAKSAIVVQPDGVVVEHRFGALWNHNEGRLLGVYTRDAGGTLLRTEVHEYVTDEDVPAMPFAATYGLLTASDDASVMLNRPLRATVISQDGAMAGPDYYVAPSAPSPPSPPCPPYCDVPAPCEPEFGGGTCNLPASGDGAAADVRENTRDPEATSASGGNAVPASTFARTVLQFDALSRPRSVRKESSLGNSKVETTDYFDAPNAWVMGQVQRLTIDDIETSRTVYDVQTAQPTRVYAFGRLQHALTHYPDGTLASVADGRQTAQFDTTVLLSGWKRGIPQRIAYPAADGGSAGTEATAEVDHRGWIEAVVDEAGSRTCYEYDQMGRITRTIYPSEQMPAACDTTTWQATTVHIERAATMQNGLPPGHWRRIEETGNGRRITSYDAMWRPLVEETLDLGGVAASHSWTARRYDLAGRLAFVSYPRNPSATPGTGWASDLPGTHTAYDALGRPVRVEQDSELGRLTTRTEYMDQLRTRTTNPRSQITITAHRAYDVPQYDDPQGISDLGVDRHTEIYRDVLGRVVTLQRRNGAHTQSILRQHVYDAEGRLCKTVEPESGSTVYGYDEAGNIAWSAGGLHLPSWNACDREAAQASGRRVDRFHDARNRLVAMVFPDGNGNQQLRYGAHGLPESIVTYNDDGSSSVENRYAYNRRRMLAEEQVSQAGWYSWSLKYQFNPAGHLSALTYPSGNTVQLAPDGLGRATRVGNYVSAVTYHPNGAVAGFVYGNGVAHTASQNLRQLVARSTHSLGVLDLEQAYDANGNVEAILDRGPDGLHRYLSYDEGDRLVAAGSAAFGGDHWHRFQYDSLDNLKSWKLGGVKDFADYHYDASNRLTNIRDSAGATIVGLGYDPQGNLTNKNGVAFRFDLGNRLRAAADESYRYDGHGRRVLKWSAGLGATRYQYGLAGQLLHQHAAARQESTDYLYLGGRLVATHVYQHAKAGRQTITYQHTDTLGSPVATTDQAGRVIDRTQWEPFGAAVGKPNVDGVGYTGHVMDSGTGLTYMQQRYYDPTTGRFLSVDPVVARSKGDNFNRYAYAFSNPYTVIDPDGREGRVSFPTATGYVTSPFGRRTHPVTGRIQDHNGADFKAERGAAIHSTQDGVVAAISFNAKAGNYILVQNSDGSLAGYAHTSASGGTRVGDEVEAGQVIGRSDGSGRLTGPHLHYTYRPAPSEGGRATLSTKPVDPVSTQLRNAKPPQSSTSCTGTRIKGAC
jgi:RHS repeat-associated protein